MHTVWLSMAGGGDGGLWAAGSAGVEGDFWAALLESTSWSCSSEWQSATGEEAMSEGKLQSVLTVTTANAARPVAHSPRSSPVVDVEKTAAVKEREAQSVTGTRPLHWSQWRNPVILQPLTKHHQEKEKNYFMK